MKKLLLCLALVCCLSFVLIACNNNKDDSNNNNDNDSYVDDENRPAIDDSYKTPDFSRVAGFKVNFGENLAKEATYDSIILMNDTVAQLDLVFTDDTIGTLLVDSNATTNLDDVEDAILVENTRVAVEKDAIGVNIYTWVKDDFVLSFYTNEDLRESTRLPQLINEISIEITD